MMQRAVPSALTRPESGDSGAVAELTDVHLGFERSGQTIHALRGVSLRLRPGEVFGLVGESGSGKSVLGLTLLGLLPSGADLHGDVDVCGVNVRSAGREQLRRLRATSLGAVFQDPMTSLNPTMRIERQLVEACGSSTEARRLLDAVGVPDPSRRLRSYPHELSGGLRQRVMIAIAVAGRPKLVVADEPTTALDVTVQAQILLLIRELCDELGTTFLLVTHDLGVAAQIADRIGVLYAGRMAEVGPSGQVLEDPRHPYSAGLLQSRLTLDLRRDVPVTTLRGEPPKPGEETPGCPFANRCDFVTEECVTGLPKLIAVAGAPQRWTACIHADALAGRLELTSPLGVGVTEVEPPAADTGAPVALRLDGIHKFFGRRERWPARPGAHVLRGVDLEVREGEAVALVGESGCGKSTLLRVAAGLTAVDGGRVEVGGGDSVQMVFQDAGASLTPWLTIGELIGERLLGGGLSRAQRRDRVTEALRSAGLPPEVASAKGPQLSGGQRQRACLARAIVIPPKVLLCDEPTSALDVSLAAVVLNMIGQLRRELGMAVLFVTHDLASARIVSDRIAVMYLGRIVEVGEADEVTSRPAHPYTQALLGAVPHAGARPMALPGEPANAARPPTGCAFHPRCPQAEPACRDGDPVLTRSESGRDVACWKQPPVQLLPAAVSS